MPNDKPVTPEEEHHEEPVTPVPASAPAPAIVPEKIETHPVEDPLKAVIDLITNNHKEVTIRLDNLEKGKETNDANKGKQEPAPAPAEPVKPVVNSEPKPKRKLHLFRTI